MASFSLEIVWCGTKELVVVTWEATKLVVRRGKSNSIQEMVSKVRGIRMVNHWVPSEALAMGYFISRLGLHSMFLYDNLETATESLVADMEL